MANPLGYARKGEQLAFKPGLLIEIGSRPAVFNGEQLHKQ